MTAPSEEKVRLPLKTFETLPDGPLEASHTALAFHRFHGLWTARTLSSDKRNCFWEVPTPALSHAACVANPFPEDGGA